MEMVVDVVKEVPEDQILCKIQRPLFDSESDYGKLFIHGERRTSCSCLPSRSEGAGA